MQLRSALPFCASAPHRNTACLPKQGCSSGPLWAPCVVRKKHSSDLNLRRVSKLYVKGACVNSRDNNFGIKSAIQSVSCDETNDATNATCMNVIDNGARFAAACSWCGTAVLAFKRLQISPL